MISDLESMKRLPIRKGKVRHKFTDLEEGEIPVHTTGNISNILVGFEEAVDTLARFVGRPSHLRVSVTETWKHKEGTCCVH